MADHQDAQLCARLIINVQPIGADPRKVTREMTEVYGVGAFLLAGNQIYKMAQ